MLYKRLLRRFKNEVNNNSENANSLDFRMQ